LLGGVAGGDAADRVHWRFRSAPFCATARSRFWLQC